MPRVLQKKPTADALEATLVAAASGKPMQLKAMPYAAASQALSPTSEGSRGSLPSGLQAGIEGLSGLPMNDVNVHYNSPKPTQMKAHAFAQGTDIHVAPGQESALPHEAWHVVQQKQGRVAPTVQKKGVDVNDDTALEREADVMGAKALAAGSGALADFSPKPVSPASGAASGAVQHKPVLQGDFWEYDDSKSFNWKEGDPTSDHVDSGKTRDESDHNGPIYYTKEAWMLAALDHEIEYTDDVIQGVEKGNENLACWNWALLGFSDTGVFPQHVLNYIGMQELLQELGADYMPVGFTIDKWIKDNIPEKEGRQWFLDNKDTIDQLVTKRNKLLKGDKYTKKQINHWAIKQLVASLIEANGFEISDEPTPYAICMHYKRSDGVTFDHWWLNYRGTIVETFPYTSADKSEDGEEHGVKDIQITGSEQEHYDDEGHKMGIVRYYVKKPKKKQVDHIVKALNNHFQNDDE